MAIDKWLPIPSKTPNAKEHWGKVHQLRNKQRYWIWYLFELCKKDIPPLPCEITLTRTGPRNLDYDNFVYSQKYIRDAIAEHLIKDSCPGRADGDPRLRWVYKQEKGEIGVRIEIKTLE